MNKLLPNSRTEAMRAILAKHDNVSDRVTESLSDRVRKYFVGINSISPKDFSTKEDLIRKFQK